MNQDCVKDAAPPRNAAIEPAPIERRGGGAGGVVVVVEQSRRETQGRAGRGGREVNTVD